MRVSVIVPVYNVERYLRQCLEGLRSQTLEDIEFVCVDDGSTDSSLSILKEYAQQDDRFKVISKPNAGYGHTINCGLKAAVGDYVGMVESDDFCTSTMFERLYSCAIENSLDIVRSAYYLYWSQPSEKLQLVSDTPEDFCNKVFSPVEYKKCFFLPPALWSMLVSRSVIESHDLTLLETPGASYQDTSFSFKLWACSKRAMVLSEAFLRYRQDNEASSINQKDKIDYVPLEYREIERFLSNDLEIPELLPVMIKRKFAAYQWNYERMDTSYRSDFAKMFSSEFCKAKAEGLLDKDLYSSNEWSELLLLIRDSARYVSLKDEKNGLSKNLFFVTERMRRVISFGGDK